jgi:hypothetical protein
MENNMKFKALGTKLIISENTKEKNMGGIFISEVGFFRSGRVVSVGSKVEGQFNVDDEVVYAVEKTAILGLGADPSVVVIDEKDLVAKKEE